MKVVGEPFVNSSTCKGVAFSDPKLSHDLSIISISGRYPEKGAALNSISHELVYILKGEGSITIEGEVEHLKSGEVVSVPPDKHFYWQGDMELIMSCQPAFNPEQYNLEEQYEI